MEKRGKLMECLFAACTFLSLGAAEVWAKEKTNVLDFEADVIEGEKRKPDLFLQMEGDVGSLDAILYSREDFNDYHESDRKWRPRIHKLMGVGGKKP